MSKVVHSGALNSLFSSDIFWVPSVTASQIAEIKVYTTRSTRSIIWFLFHKLKLLDFEWDHIGFHLYIWHLFLFPISIMITKGVSCNAFVKLFLHKFMKLNVTLDFTEWMCIAWQPIALLIATWFCLVLKNMIKSCY